MTCHSWAQFNSAKLLICPIPIIPHVRYQNILSYTSSYIKIKVHDRENYSMLIDPGIISADKLWICGFMVMWYKAQYILQGFSNIGSKWIQVGVSYGLHETQDVYSLVQVQLLLLGCTWVMASNWSIPQAQVRAGHIGCGRNIHPSRNHRQPIRQVKTVGLAK